MDVNAFVDLRELQQRLPQLASRTITASCGVDLDVDLDQAFADGDQVRATGTVRARLYRCKNKGTEDESRGMRLLSPRIGVDATATAVIEGKCVKFNLTDIELDPQGAIGGIADVFGLTERVRTAILEKSRSYLAENPVCPRLPENLAVLNPEYVDGGPREIGEHGMGVALSGSVDTSAGTLLTLLELVKKRGIVGGVR